MWILWSVFLITEKCYQTQHEGLLLGKHLVYLPHCWTVRHAMLQIIPRHAIWQQGGQPTAPYYKLSPDMSYDNGEGSLQCLTTNYPQTCHMTTGRAAYSALLKLSPDMLYDNREGSLQRLTTNYPKTCYMTTGRAAYSALLQTTPIWQQGGQPTAAYYKLSHSHKHIIHIYLNENSYLSKSVQLLYHN